MNYFNGVIPTTVTVQGSHHIMFSFQAAPVAPQGGWRLKGWGEGAGRGSAGILNKKGAGRRGKVSTAIMKRRRMLFLLFPGLGVNVHLKAGGH